MPIALLRGMMRNTQTKNPLVIAAVNATDPDHLDYVVKKMIELGAPKLRAIWSDCYGMWFAIEGSHRLAAAEKLGLTPIIDDVTGEDVITQRDECDTHMASDELEEWIYSDVANQIIFEF